MVGDTKQAAGMYKSGVGAGLVAAVNSGAAVNSSFGCTSTCANNTALKSYAAQPGFALGNTSGDELEISNLLSVLAIQAKRQLQMARNFALIGLLLPDVSPNSR